MSIGERPPYFTGGAGGGAGGSGFGIGSGPNAPMGPLAPMSIMHEYSAGTIDQKLKEIDAEIEKIANTIEGLRSVSDALCGPMASGTVDLKPRAVVNGIVGRLEERRTILAEKASALAELVARLQTL